MRELLLEHPFVSCLLGIALVALACASSNGEPGDAPAGSATSALAAGAPPAVQAATPAP